MEIAEGKNKIKHVKIGLYTFFCLSFVVFIHDMPIVGSKIQLAEILFIPLALMTMSVVRTRLREYKILPVDKIILVFAAVYTALCFVNNISKTYLEVIGLAYFIGIYFVFNLFYQDIDYGILKKIFYVTVFIVSITGLVGIVLTHCNIDTYLAWSKNSAYPYFGGMGRARGLSGHPNNLLMLIGFSWLFLYTDIVNKRNRFELKEQVFFVVTLMAAVLTFSKMVILILIGLILIYSFYNFNRSKTLVNLSVLFLSFLLIIGTHWGVYNLKSDAYKALVKVGLISDSVIYNFGENKGVIQNNYAMTKKAAIILGVENQPFGIGFGQFVRNYQTFIDRGIFTKYMSAFEPHSLYTGFWVEGGGVGLLTLLLTIIFLIKWLKVPKIMAGGTEADMYRVCSVIMFLYLIDGIITDVFFLRYYFIFFVLLTALVRKQKIYDITARDT